MPILKGLGKPKKPAQPAWRPRRNTVGVSAKKAVKKATERSSTAGATRRKLPRGVVAASVDASGLPVDGKYKSLGPHNRQNAMIAIGDGMVYTGQSGTTEEMCCYGEFIRRGFAYGLGSSPRSFQWQVPDAGSILDFEVWDRGTRYAVRPMNQYWHGHLAKIVSDARKAEKLVQAGLVVADIWSGDSLDDLGIVTWFNLWFGDETGALGG